MGKTVKNVGDSGIWVLLDVSVNIPLTREYYVDGHFRLVLDRTGELSRGTGLC